MRSMSPLLSAWSPRRTTSTLHCDMQRSLAGPMRPSPMRCATLTPGAPEQRGGAVLGRRCDRTTFLARLRRGRGGELAAGGDAELAVDVAGVRTDRLHADMQGERYLSV